MAQKPFAVTDENAVPNLHAFNTLFGLPDSMIQWNGKTIQVISILQGKGLNREFKRKLLDRPQFKGDDQSTFALNKLSVNCSEADKQLIFKLGNPYLRCSHFWHAMNKHAKDKIFSFTRVEYTTAIDILWIEDYASDWAKNTYEEDALKACCEIWTDICKALNSRFVKKGNGDLDFRVFMIWPRIVRDLSNWSAVDSDQRLIIGRAAFALSTISTTDWFLRQAVKICPDIANDFSFLSENADKPDGNNQKPTSHEEGSKDVWSGLLLRLDELVAALRVSPTQADIASLQDLVARYVELAPTLPSGKRSSMELLTDKVNEFNDACLKLGKEPNFSWLDSDLVEQLNARWHLELFEETNSIDAILLDIEDASSRLELASQNLQQVVSEKRASDVEHSEFSEKIVGVQTVGERRIFEQKKREIQKKLIGLEETITKYQDNLLAAGSPFCKEFNYQFDYKSKLQYSRIGNYPTALVPVNDAKVHDGPVFENQANATVNGTVLTTGVAEKSDAEFEMDLPIANLYEGGVQLHEDAEESNIKVSPPVYTSNNAIPTIAFDVSSGDTNTSIISDELPLVNDDVYNDLAGEICRPIWQLLADGHYSMASIYVAAISSQEDSPLMPPLALVEAIALADAMTLPDGNIRDAITGRLQIISENSFEDDGYASWHTALNLLLIAATLRPMVLIPDSGASVVANYLHLDSQHRYPYLWKLVGSIRESSERLRGFRIELASLRSARDEAANKSDLQNLQEEAQVWLKKRAPSLTIKFAPATKVWNRWLQPEGIIHQLLTPVINNDVTQKSKLESLVRELTESQSFQKLVQKADRSENSRKRGSDIHSGALDHLSRCCEDAITYVRRWLSLSSSTPDSNDRMKELLLQIRTNVAQLISPVRSELTQIDTGRWQLVGCAQKAVLKQINGLTEMFDTNLPLAISEASAAEVLVMDLLCVPSIRVTPNWTVESPVTEVIAAILDWCSSPVSWPDAFESRVNVGDLPAAKCLLDCHYVEAEENGLYELLNRETENWRAKLKSRITDCQREIEVGSAYGYVSDSERNQHERELTHIEAGTEDTPRFNVALEFIEGIRKSVRANRAQKATFIEKAVSSLKSKRTKFEDVEAIQSSLDEGDMATAHELLQRVNSGLPAWPEEAKVEDVFHAFIRNFKAIEDLGSSRLTPVDIQAAIKNGSFPGLDFQNVAGAQRNQAANMFADWTFLKSRKAGDANRLHSLLCSLGFILDRSSVRQDSAPGKEIWIFSGDSISDRKVCPTPHFGSSAKGTYRTICLWQRPIEDDIVQLVGDSNLHRATIVLYFGRMTDGKWRELSRKTKLARKSFLLLDETLLLFLATQAGSRLSAFFATSLPFSYSDPFDATAGFVPPEMFYGRSDELNAILGLNGRCFIYGGRQLGKTALMRRAEQTFHAPDEGRWSYYIDLRAEGIGVNRTASDIWSTLAEAMKAVGMYSEVPTAADLAKKTGIDAFLKTISKFLGKSDERRMLLLLDEADRFFEQDGRQDFAETRRLKQLMDETQRRFKVIFAGLHNVLRMTERANHPLAHFGQPIKIGPFIEEHEIREARELIRLPLASAGFEFESRSLIMRILAQTNYYPSLIQLYCNHLLKHMLKRLGDIQRLAGPRYKISNHDIEAVYSSSDLRGEIRAKFNFTLQLDPRYEVIAYGMAYEALDGRFGHVEGMEWRSIWVECALTWWSEGFHDTSELDFRVLLDEMVELGVLRFQSGRYCLRNPNILLLLGNKDEIETVLARNRFPTLEFDSAVFHPHVWTKGSSHLRHPLTFQQISEILKPKNSVSAIAGVPAAEIDKLGIYLREYIEKTGAGICHITDGIADRQAFAVVLRDLIDKRNMKGHTVVVVPSTVPWSGLWVHEAKDKLAHLKSLTGHVSICFIADPDTLWGTLTDNKFAEMDIPWITLLPWGESFVRQYLEDQQLTTSPEVIKAATGYWPTLLYPLVAQCNQVLELERNARMGKAKLEDRLEAEGLMQDFGMNVATAKSVLSTMAEFGQASAVEDLSELAEVSIKTVTDVLQWGKLLGIVRREGLNHWRLDEVVEQLYVALRD